ncbi:hypothetical protein HPB47_026411 [Ixodes persulcatus]|uniref:Uncharacterized protein n=1 Tax=Ixodes persulcatus TaxID=34615 RepID=A0AC60Q179_IXOPE|nr:hypothetical protein HPB47_026411 [Ixodes persulcatus]
MLHHDDPFSQRDDANWVYKKQSPNSRLTLYLSTREFVHATSRTTVSAIDGVVLVDPAYLKDRRVYAMVLLTFRYGREDEEVMGLKFFTEAILDFKQVYPEPSSTGSGAAISGVGARDGSGAADELTPLQQNLLKKLGGDAYPVTLRISSQAPPSVRLHPARPYQGSPLGVSYELKVFIGLKQQYVSIGHPACSTCSLPSMVLWLRVNARCSRDAEAPSKMESSRWRRDS